MTQMKKEISVYQRNGNEIVIDLPGNENLSQLEIAMFSLTGQTVYQHNSKEVSNKISIKPQLQPGVYITMVKRGNEIYTGKVLVKQ